MIGKIELEPNEYISDLGLYFGELWRRGERPAALHQYCGVSCLQAELDGNFYRILNHEESQKIRVFNTDFWYNQIWLGDKVLTPSQEEVDYFNQLLKEKRYVEHYNHQVNGWLIKKYGHGWEEIIDNHEIHPQIEQDLISEHELIEMIENEICKLCSTKIKILDLCEALSSIKVIGCPDYPDLNSKEGYLVWHNCD